MAPSTVIRAAANFVTRELEASEEHAFNYSHCYDGTTEKEKWLTEQVGVEFDGRYSPEVLVDLAVNQLERMAILKTTRLESKLADGEPDYRIQFTKPGRALHLTGPTLHFFDAE